MVFYQLFFPLRWVLYRALFLALCYFPLFINDIVYQNTSCRVHFYAEDVQIYIRCELHRIENCIRNMNMDLDRIHQWSIEICLATNPEKSQALLVNPLSIVSPLLLGSKHIAFVDKVKNMGFIFNQELVWHDQVAKLYQGVFFTLRWFWTSAHFTPIETRR
jgi:hypothetical protein